MNEATLKVTPITDKQPQPACRFSITATLDGFPIEIQGEGRPGDLRTIVDRLKAISATPPQRSQAVTAEPTKKTAPLCPDHGTPMKASRKPGTWFCPRQTDDGGYYPHKS
jgi:hypothetical protein